MPSHNAPCSHAYKKYIQENCSTCRFFWTSNGDQYCAPCGQTPRNLGPIPYCPTTLPCVPRKLYQLLMTLHGSKQPASRTNLCTHPYAPGPVWTVRIQGTVQLVLQKNILIQDLPTSPSQNVYLKASISLKPTPQLFHGTESFSQLAQGTLRCPLYTSHQNFSIT